MKPSKSHFYLLSFIISTIIILSAVFASSSSSPARASNAAEELLQQSTSDYIYEPITPAVVNLADLAGKPAREPINLITEYRYREDSIELEGLKKFARDLPTSESLQIATSGAGTLAPTPGTNFDSIDITECCGSGVVVPPDPDMAAGPNHLIAVVNLSFEIYDKSGTSLVGPATLASLLSPAGGGCTSPFDPTVVYDEEADRWAIGADGDGTHFCIAVSQTNDPTGSYNIYAVPAQPVGGEFHDYPHMGVGDSYIVVGANQFGGSIPGGFEGRVWALDKSNMYSGGAMTPVSASTGGTEGTPQPLYLHGFNQGTWPAYGSTHFFATDPYDGCTLNIWQWDIPSPPAIVATFNLCTATGVSGGLPVPVPQSSGATLEANDWRMRGFEYRNSSGWIADSISCNPGVGTVDCVRWTQVDMSGTPSLLQAGVYASNDDYRTFPDLAVDKNDNMAIGYTKSNSSMFPGIWYTGRLSSDPLGILQPEAELKSGDVTYYAFDGAPLRWGDYTGMTIDPDGETFWYLGEYSKDLGGVPSANWGTYIGSFTYMMEPDIEINPTSLSNTLEPNTIVTDTLTLSNTGSLTLTWTITDETMIPLIIPASEGDFPRGNHTPSAGAPPQLSSLSDIKDSGAPYIPMNTSAYATETQNGIFVEFDLNTPETLNAIITFTQYVWAGDFVGADFTKSFNIKDDNNLVTIDTATGVETIIGTVPAPPANHLYTGMAYDPTTGTMYASSCDITTSYLYVVDLVTPNTTQVGQITNSPCTIGIGFDDTGNLYGFDLVNDSLISIEKNTAAGTVIGLLGYDANFGQGMDFDSTSGQMYLAAFNNSTLQAELRIVDLTTGNTTLINPLGSISPGGLTQLGWLAIASAACIPGDIPWSSVDPILGDIQPGDATNLEVTFDASGLAEGTYDGSLCIASNDPDEPYVRVPLELTVDAIPVLEYTPPMIEVGVTLGDMLTRTMVISNTGSGPFDFIAQDIESGYTASMLSNPSFTCPADAFGYTCTDSSEPDGLVAYDFEDISSLGTLIILSDDVVSSELPIGFDFNFYGTKYTGIHASSNGFLTVLPGQSSGCCTGQIIPSAGNPDGVIASWWEDLNPGEAGAEIYYATLGTAPFRRFIVQFTNVQHFPSGTPVTFQYKLFELSNNIEMHYMDAPSDGGTHSVGIENETGVVGLQYYRGTTELGTPLAVCFLYPGRSQCGSGGVDAPWVFEEPITGTLDVGMSMPIDIVFDSSVVTATGTYSAELYFLGTFDNLVYPAPLIMHVITEEFSIEFTKTVGSDPNTCATTDEITIVAGTQVTYCYQVMNTGEITLTAHDLVDSHLGVLLDDFAYDLAPGASVLITQTATILTDTVNTATWKASDGPFVVEANNSATVNTIPAEFGVELSSDEAQSGVAGEMVAYTLNLTNTGNFVDTFDISVTGNLWSVDLSAEDVTLGAGESAEVIVHVTIPAGAAFGDFDVATITATSQSNATVNDSSNLTTSVSETWIYLPIIYK